MKVEPQHIIDAHCHIGTSLVSGVEITEEQLLRTMTGNGIGMAMVMPQPHQGMEVAPVHDRIARIAEATPGVIYGMVNLSPRLEEGEYRAEVERCIRGHGFRALKLDPSVSALPINHARCEIVFATAREYGVPVIIHTGMGVPNALPARAIPPALRYPDVTIVLAHAGFAIFAAEAIVAAQVCPNIVLEPSWCASYQVAEMVRAVGAEQVMFGSDHPSNVASELAKLRSIGLTDEQLEAVLGGTARRVFGV
jgi:predicted TIM-barrel fold metal-dependent hydrolase